jgi:hypothetical protein
VKASADSWKREGFTSGLSIPYHESFTDDEFSKIGEGLIPKVMEDKWFIYFEQPYLFLHRSWTGKPVYRVCLAAIDERAIVTEALCAADLLEPGGPEYHAKLLDFLIGNLLLAKAKLFPMLKNFTEKSKGLLQHHISGTGYSQT